MREVKVAHLCQSLARSACGPLLGLDVGTKYVGVAISDAEYRVAQPLSALERKASCPDRFAVQLQELVQRHAARTLVIGYPLKISGFLGKQGPMVQHFVEELVQSERFKDIGYLYWDERLTSKQVDVAIRFFKLDARRKKRILDKMAAVCILQSCLDNMVKNRSHHLQASADVKAWDVDGAR